MNKTRAKDLMDKLDITEAEALQVIADDKAIDAGEKLFELSAEQKRASKQARTSTSAEAKPQERKPREKKIDADKHAIFAALANTVLNDLDTAVTITTEDRQMDFEYNGKKFRVVLSAPRK